jgi:hypothetical protein
MEKTGRSSGLSGLRDRCNLRVRGTTRSISVLRQVLVLLAFQMFLFFAFSTTTEAVTFRWYVNSGANDKLYYIYIDQTGGYHEESLYRFGLMIIIRRHILKRMVMIYGIIG